MRWKHLTIAGALLGLLGAGAVIAQTITQTDLSGNECWQAGQGPGGPGSYICANLVRGSQPAVAGTPIASYIGSLTFGSGVLSKLANGGTIIFPTQPTNTVTLTAPAAPADGAIISMCNPTGAAFATTTTAMVANTGQTFNVSGSTTTLASSGCFEFQFTKPTATWYRIR